MLPKEVKDKIVEMVLISFAEREMSNGIETDLDTIAKLRDYWKDRFDKRGVVLFPLKGRYWGRHYSVSDIKAHVGQSVWGIDGSMKVVTNARTSGLPINALSAVAVKSLQDGKIAFDRGMWFVISEKENPVTSNAIGMIALEMKVAVSLAQFLNTVNEGDSENASEKSGASDKMDIADTIVSALKQNTVLMDGTWVISALSTQKQKDRFFGTNLADAKKIMDKWDKNKLEFFTLIAQHADATDTASSGYAIQKNKDVPYVSEDDVRFAAEQVNLVCVVSNPHTYFLRPVISSGLCTQSEDTLCMQCPFTENGKPTREAPCRKQILDVAMMRSIAHTSKDVFISAPWVIPSEKFPQLAWVVVMGRRKHAMLIKWAMPQSLIDVIANTLGDLTPSDVLTNESFAGLGEEITAAAMPMLADIIIKAIAGGGHPNVLNVADEFARITYSDISDVQMLARNLLSRNTKEQMKRKT